jgi:hypothetical protein
VSDDPQALHAEAFRRGRKKLMSFADALVITLGVRGAGTCELLIPAERFGPASPADQDSLIACLMNPEGTA